MQTYKGKNIKPKINVIENKAHNIGQENTMMQPTNALRHMDDTLTTKFRKLYSEAAQKNKNYKFLVEIMYAPHRLYKIKLYKSARSFKTHWN